jgi:cysteinyl-tRNA synthetase
VTGVPDEIRSLAEEREQARRDRDYARADALRERIREAGFEVADTPAGPEVAARTAGSGEGRPDVHARSEDVPSVLDRPARGEPTIQWVVQGWPEDVHRGFRSVSETLPTEFQPVIVDTAGAGALDWYRGELLHVSPRAGWAVAQNAGLRRAAGDVVIVMDGSIELTGDGVTMLRDALEDPTVGVTGPFGIVTDDLREFRQSEGPDVDAVEGYLMAFRRELLQRGLRFDETFKFYRTADIEFSFQVKALGLRATVTPLPLIRHEHRVWASTPAEERDRLSKRNFYRFLDRWRGRTDLLVSSRSERGG